MEVTRVGIKYNTSINDNIAPSASQGITFEITNKVGGTFG